MMTSNFTLRYYGFDGRQKPDAARYAPNIPCTPMPKQLHRLGVPASVWTKIYDHTNQVVERAAIRENKVRDLQHWLYLKKERGGCTAEDKERVAREITNHDFRTFLEWTNLLKEYTSELGAHGVSATVAIHSETQKIFGIDFRCDASKLLPNKLKLEFDHYLNSWTWPRNEVPMELAALHVDTGSWSSVWDKVQRTYREVEILERHKNIVKSNLSNTLVDTLVDYSRNFGLAKYKEALKEVDRLEQAMESEWGKLEEFAGDIFYMWGISVSLSYGDENSSAKYCGIILRFKPTVSTAQVINEAVAMALPFAT